MRTMVGVMGSRRTLDGKVVVITGSTRGIGRAIAEGCAEHGATLVLSSRSETAVHRAVHDFAAAGRPCSGITCDVARPEDVRALFEHAIEYHGGVDVWVNNAGVSEGYRPLDELSPDELATIVSINLLGTMYACRLLVPYLRDRGGVLLNMAGRGFRGDATPHTAAYAATKAAIASLTASIAKENADEDRIHIHALVPGMVPTDFYRDVTVSPRLEATRGNVDLALDAFGVSLASVAEETSAFLARDAWRGTGRVHNLLRGRRTMRGIALMTWWRMTGKMRRR